MKLKDSDLFDIIAVVCMGIVLLIAFAGGFAFAIMAISGHIAFK